MSNLKDETLLKTLDRCIVCNKKSKLALCDKCFVKHLRKLSRIQKGISKIMRKQYKQRENSLIVGRDD